MAVTLMDISKRVSLTPATVSRILGGHPGFSENACQRVHAVAKELGYRPNLAARGLLQNKSLLIGIMDRKCNTWTLADFLEGVQTAAIPHRYSSLVFVHESLEAQERNLQLCLDRHIDGLLVTVQADRDGTVHAGELEDLIKRKFPIIETHGHCLKNIPSVRFDYHAAGIMAARHLLSLGHRCIALFPHEQEGIQPYSSGFWYRHEYVKGCVNTIEKAGANVFLASPICVKQHTELEWRAAARQAVNEILACPLKPTALICMGTEETVTTYRVLQDAGVQIPKQLSVIGYETIGVETFIMPSFTMVRNRSNKVGQLAMEKLLERIDGRKVESALTGPEISVGVTTAQPHL